MIKYLTNTEINKSKWDKCISDASNGYIYAYSWYLDIVCNGWDALVLNDYEAVFPLTWGKKYGIYYLYQPFFTQQLGLFSANELNGNILNHFLEAIPRKFRHIDICLNSANKINKNQYKVSSRVTHYLNLNREYEQINSLYSYQIKRNIKKALKNEIQITNNIKTQKIIQLFRENASKLLIKIKPKHYKILDKLIEEGLRMGYAEPIAALDKTNQLCAGAVFFQSHKKAIYILAATNSNGRNTGAMSLLIDRYIASNSNTNLVIDFEGSIIPSVAKFYKGFDAYEVPYWVYRKKILGFKNWIYTRS